MTKLQQEAELHAALEFYDYDPELDTFFVMKDEDGKELRFT